MAELYPLRFEPILKEKIWGGSTLVAKYGKTGEGLKNVGESWELSAVSGNLSVVSNGFLAGNNIQEIIEVYMGDLVGDPIYERFGIEFPLLIKLIEAREDLSVQVHPGNELAKERHDAYGKTEMWYILESERGARIFTGFSKPVSKEEYINALKNNTIQDLLNVETAERGDAFYTPAGRIHAIGAGVVLAEIQQTSDITYRIYDWGRTAKKGAIRELHTGLALDAINFSAYGKSKIRKDLRNNKSENLVKCEFFDINIIHLDNLFERDYNLIDSFIIYICTEGSFLIRWENNSETVSMGETILLPAMIRDIILEPQPHAMLLEIYVSN